MVPGVDPKVDYLFKKVFGSQENTPVLLDVLEAVLKPPADRSLVTVDIRNPFNEKDALDDKLSILDIKAQDQLGRLYNVEMQMVATRLYPPRVLYYWAVLHSQQLREGTDYGSLQDTISISFVNSVLFPQIPDHHLEFQLRSSQHPELIFSGQQRIHVVELPKFQKKAEELTDSLDVWCYFLIHGAELDTDNLPPKLQTPAVRRAMEIMQMFSQDEQERYRYEARLKFQRDQVSFVKDALAEGMEKGRKQGWEEGEVLGRIHLCQRLLKLPLMTQEEFLALPLSELLTKAADLEQRLAAAVVG